MACLAGRVETRNLGQLFVREREAEREHSCEARLAGGRTIIIIIKREEGVDLH